MNNEKKKPISAVVLVKNHRKHIRACLETLRWADEVVVVNDDSTDGTVTIAKEFPNVVVYDHALNMDFAQQRNFGGEKATGDWVFQVDADHRITKELAAEIIEKTRDTPYQAFGLKYWGFVLGRIFGNEKNEVPFPSLIRKNKGVFLSDNQTHSRPRIEGTTGVISEPVIHLGPYLESTSFFTKNAFYADTESKTNVEQNKKIPPRAGIGIIYWFLIKPFLIFLQKYFSGGCWKRGVAGFNYAILRAIGYYMVYLRTWERYYIEKLHKSEMHDFCRKRSIPIFLD